MAWFPMNSLKIESGVVGAHVGVGCRNAFLLQCLPHSAGLFPSPAVFPVFFGGVYCCQCRFQDGMEVAIA